MRHAATGLCVRGRAHVCLGGRRPWGRGQGALDARLSHAPAQRGCGHHCRRGRLVGNGQPVTWHEAASERHVRDVGILDRFECGLHCGAEHHRQVDGAAYRMTPLLHDTAMAGRARHFCRAAGMAACGISILRATHADHRCIDLHMSTRWDTLLLRRAPSLLFSVLLCAVGLSLDGAS